MKFRTVLTALFMCMFFHFDAAEAQVTKEDISAAIKKADLKHPYLLFNEKDKPAMLARIENEPEYRDIMRRLLTEANRLLFIRVDSDLLIEPRNPRMVPSNPQITHFNRAKANALTLAFVYQMTGDERYAQKAFEYADIISDYPTWVYRAHEFPIIYSRVWPWGVDDDQYAFGFDIRSGHTAIEMALVYDWCYDVFTKRQRDRIRGALFDKVILPTRGNYDYHWWAHSYRCNWLGICFSGIGTAAMALLTENPELVDVVAESYNRMGKMFDEIGIDGEWQEGRSYWAYGFRGCLPFMESLNRLTGGKYSLFRHRSWQNNPADFALYGITGNFGDGSGAIVGSTFMLNKLVEESKCPTAAWYRNTFLGNGSSLYDIIWPRSDVSPVKPTVASKHFRTIDWVFMRTDFRMPEAVEIAAKAGWNDDPHHGHLDCGNIILTWQGEAFLNDLGGGNYDERYFDEARWEYPHASSAAHNVISVNGELQISAKYKDQPWQEGVGGRVLEFRTTPSRDYTLMDPSGAYPGKELKGWRRHIVLDKPLVTVLLDEISSASGAELEVRFHSAATIQNRADYVLLRGQRGNMAIITVCDSPPTVRPGRHAYMPVREGVSFEWLPYVGNIVTAKTEKTDVFTIIAPVEDDSEARELIDSIKKAPVSGGVALTFVHKGETSSFTFRNTREGLVLVK